MAGGNVLASIAVMDSFGGGMGVLFEKTGFWVLKCLTGLIIK